MLTFIIKPMFKEYKYFIKNLFGFSTIYDFFYHLFVFREVRQCAWYLIKEQFFRSHKFDSDVNRKLQIAVFEIRTFSSWVHFPSSAISAIEGVGIVNRGPLFKKPPKVNGRFSIPVKVGAHINFHWHSQLNLISNIKISPTSFWT